MESIKIMSDEYYIHFDTSNECTKFRQTAEATFGHVCCSGKGVLLKTFNKIPIKNNQQIYNIKNSITLV